MMVGQNSNGNNLFYWDHDEEPHKLRRAEILQKHPEIKKLMQLHGDRWLMIQGLFFLALQFVIAMWSSSQSSPFASLIINCFIGNWVASMLMFHIHEAVHGLVFGPSSVWKNRIYGHILNFGLGLPFYSYFKKHHKNHHKYLGDQVLDAEHPSEFEVNFFPNTFLGKYCWFVFQPVFASYRLPFLILKNPCWMLDFEESFNIFSITCFGIACIFTEYPFLWCHFAWSTWAASGSNMFGYWGVMSHTVFFKASKETFSYYGWLNHFFMNFGYHMEHHDFPNIPSRLLPQVRKIAAEYYEDVIQLDSFHTAAVKYLADPSIGIFSRVKRPYDATKVPYFGPKKYNF